MSHPTVRFQQSGRTHLRHAYPSRGAAATLLQPGAQAPGSHAIISPGRVAANPAGLSIQAAECVNLFFDGVPSTITAMDADSTPPYHGRLAPSPTGLLHLGHACTFWTAYQRVLQNNGVLIFRNEDLDPQRSRTKYAEAMLDDLRWLGIRWGRRVLTLADGSRPTSRACGDRSTSRPGGDCEMPEPSIPAPVPVRISLLRPPPRTMAMTSPCIPAAVGAALVKPQITRFRLA